MKTHYRMWPALPQRIHIRATHKPDSDIILIYPKLHQIFCKPTSSQGTIYSACFQRSKNGYFNLLINRKAQPNPRKFDTGSTPARLDCPQPRARAARILNSKIRAHARCGGCRIAGVRGPVSNFRMAPENVKGNRTTKVIDRLRIWLHKFA